MNLIHRARAIRPAAALAFLGFAAVLVTGCSQESKIARHTTRADAFFAEGDYDKARIEYLNIVQLDPQNAHAVARLGNIFFENGMVLQAGAVLAQARNLGATDPRISARLGVLLAASRRPDATPEQNELRLKEARESAMKALEADPKLEEAILLLADLANDEASTTEFKELLGRLRAQHGDLPVYDTAEAVVALKGRDLDRALALVRKVADADPDSAAAHYVLAGVLLGQTNQVAGGAAFARAAELSPARSTRQIQYVNFLLQRGATNEARAHLDQVITRAPDFVPGRLRKAQLAFVARDYEAVGTELNAVLTRDPNNIDARVLEAQLHLAKREPAKAQPIMEQLLKQFPDAPQLQYQAALVSLANQNPAQAQLRLDRAYELNPTAAEVVLLRGRLYLARGQAAEVINSTQRLIATNANLRPAYQLLGEALAVNGEVDRALAVFRDYERRFSDDPAGPVAVGNLLLRKQDPAGARAAFERARAVRADDLEALEQLIRLDVVEK
jgi:tetratricopeptide (TPR) repeat protein